MGSIEMAKKELDQAKFEQLVVQKQNAPKI